MNRIRQLFSGLRFRLLLLVILTCAPLVALTVNTALEDRRRQMSNWLQRSQRLTELAVREEQELAGGTRQLLLALAEASAVRNGNRRASKKLVDDLLATYPKYANLGVLSTNGEVLASSHPLKVMGDTANQTFFRRTLESRSFCIGEFRRNPRPAIDFGHPVFDRNGQVQSVVFASADLQWLDRHGSELPSQVLRGATWTKIDTNGIILSRFPRPELWVGRNYPDPNVVQNAFGRSDRMLQASGPQGKEHVYAFTPMPSQFVSGQAATILSIPRQQLFAQADRNLARNLSWLAVALGLALILGYLGSSLLVVRPVKALVRSSARLARGDLRARTGLRHGNDELGQLTLVFDLMAQALEQRELDRRKANQKLQVLSHRLVEVQESERRQIARELHDEIGQTLTAAEMNLQAALQSPSAAALERQLEDSIQAVEKVLGQVHDLSLNLRPSMLDDLGLEPALRWYTHRQAGLAGLQAEFRPVPLESRLHPIVETECFRVAQEALTNVVRHSRATMVTVELRLRDEQLHLHVSDDGVGFDVNRVREEAVGGASLGVLSMEERATLAGGHLEINSVPGEGTEVHAWFPLNVKVIAEPVFEDE